MIFFRGQFREEGSREDEPRDVISVDHKGLMGKESFRFQLPLLLSLSETPVSSALGRTGSCQEGTGSPFGVQDHRTGMVDTTDESLFLLLVPREGRYGHQQAADTLR